MDTGINHNLAHFSFQMGRYVDELGMAAPVVVKQQAGLLARTLINLTPPDNKGVLAQRIDSQVKAAFNWLGEEALAKAHAAGSVMAPSAPASGAIWYGFQADKVYGIAADKDMTASSAEDLYKLYFTANVTKQGRRNVGRRGKQTFYLWSKITTKTATVNKLAARLKSHVGRLKAGWLPGWHGADSPAGTLGPVPDWINRHRQGARGYFVDGLGTPGCPTFTLVNYARGAGSWKMGQITYNALALRSKAMAADLVLYIRGIKKVGGAGANQAGEGEA